MCKSFVGTLKHFKWSTGEQIFEVEWHGNGYRIIPVVTAVIAAVMGKILPKSAVLPC